MLSTSVQVNHQPVGCASRLSRFTPRGVYGLPLVSRIWLPAVVIVADAGASEIQSTYSPLIGVPSGKVPDITPQIAPAVLMRTGAVTVVHVLPVATTWSISLPATPNCTGVPALRTRADMVYVPGVRLNVEYCAPLASTAVPFVASESVTSEWVPLRFSASITTPPGAAVGVDGGAGGVVVLVVVLLVLLVVLVLVVLLVLLGVVVVVVVV